jgi:hypothetical protein
MAHCKTFSCVCTRAHSNVLYILFQTTGIPLDVAIRFQINLLLQPNEAIAYVSVDIAQASALNELTQN